jgi:Ca2+-binding EF-hand superfamily protein
MLATAQLCRYTAFYLQLVGASIDLMEKRIQTLRKMFDLFDRDKSGGCVSLSREKN